MKQVMVGRKTPDASSPERNELVHEISSIKWGAGVVAGAPGDHAGDARDAGWKTLAKCTPMV